MPLTWPAWRASLPDTCVPGYSEANHEKISAGFDCRNFYRLGTDRLRRRAEQQRCSSPGRRTLDGSEKPVSRSKKTGLVSEKDDERVPFGARADGLSSRACRKAEAGKPGEVRSKQ